MKYSVIGALLLCFVAHVLCDDPEIPAGTDYDIPNPTNTTNQEDAGPLENIQEWLQKTFVKVIQEAHKALENIVTRLKEWHLNNSELIENKITQWKNVIDNIIPGGIQKAISKLKIPSSK